MDDRNNGKDELACFRKHLLYEIKEGIYKDQDRLPPEAQLAEIMGVSRTLIRDNLALLEQEGFISRRQGIGTIINKHVVDVVTRVDLEIEFLEMIKEAGATPKGTLLDVASTTCNAYIAKQLGVGENTPLLQVTRLITADEKPVIFCVDNISFKLIHDYSYQREDLEKPIFHFLEKFCGVDVYMDLTVISTTLADERLAGHLAIPIGSPLLHMDEVGYDIDGQRVLYSDEYYADSILKHTVLRKKI